MTDDDDLEQLRQTVAAVNARQDALSKKLDRVINFLIGEGPELAEDRFVESRPLWKALQETQEDIDELEQTTASLAADVRARADGGEQTKVERAERHARDEVVRRAAIGDTDGIELAHIKATEVLEQSKPDQNWKYQTVKDAFENLRNRWEALYIKNDPKRLVLVKTGLERELVLTVEESLARDDLTKELISEITQTPG